MENSVVCLDTSVLIDYFRKKHKEKSYFYALLDQYESFAITSITEFEIRCGIDESQMKLWEEILSDIEVISFDSEASKLAATIDRELKRIRKQLDIADLFIAATAIRHDSLFATLNKKHFVRVERLRLIE